MRREWEPEELIACWTLVEADQELVANKSGATRLGFALLLKFFELEARFPRDVSELPPAAVSYMAEQVRVDAGELDGYAWSGRTIEYHRAQVRQAYGFRETARSDENDLAGWLAEEVSASIITIRTWRRSPTDRTGTDGLTKPPRPLLCGSGQLREFRAS